MSKKSRKNSSKLAPGGPTRGQSTTTAKAKPGKSPRAAAKRTTTRPAAATKKALAKARKSSKPAPAAGKIARVGLAEGAKAPAFHLPRDGGGTISLADYAGKKLVLFFYPRADTPGCTREAIDFTRLKDRFAEAGIAVLGISADPPKAQEAFRDKHKLAVPLVSDERHEMLQAYGAWGEKSMYGRMFEGILRTTVLVGADGRIALVWRNVRVDGHADEVLETARST